MSILQGFVARLCSLCMCECARARVSALAWVPVFMWRGVMTLKEFLSIVLVEDTGLQL